MAQIETLTPQQMRQAMSAALELDPEVAARKAAWEDPRLAMRRCATCGEPSAVLTFSGGHGGRGVCPDCTASPLIRVVD